MRDAGLWGGKATPRSGVQKWPTMERGQGRTPQQYDEADMRRRNVRYCDFYRNQLGLAYRTKHSTHATSQPSTFVMAQTKDDESVYQLYYNPFSICSLFVLYTLELKSNPKSPSDTVEPEKCFVDIYLNEQMSEAYLEKNPKGQVSFIV